MTTREGVIERLARFGRRGTDASAIAVPWLVERTRRYGDFLFALTATLVYYLPALRNRSADAGFLYGGDVMGFYWPSLAKTRDLLASFNFNALDFSLFNGSSDFFLTANFFACHPLFVAYSLLSAPWSPSFAQVGHVLALLLAFHSFIAVYYSIKLLRRFFMFEFGTAAFAAMAFAFSIYMVHGHGEPQFVFCASVAPWVAYSSLSFVTRPSVAGLLIACLPVLFGYLAGYMPLGVACIALGLALTGVRLFLLDDVPLGDRTRAFVTAVFPSMLATVLVSPYLYSVWQFQAQTTSAQAASLFFSAHQLADAPQSLLRLLSARYSVPGPLYEFSVTWGLIAVVIAALFLLSAKTFYALTAREWILLKVCAAIYFVTALCTYGEYSVVSDLVFYFVPQVGKMHIYQRFLLGAQLAFGMMIALMLKALVDTRPVYSIRVALAVLAALTLAAAYVVAKVSTLAQEMGINNYIILELSYAFLFVLALALPGRRFAIGAAVVLFTLPTLDSMYDYSHGGNVFEAQVKRYPLALDPEARASLVSYMKKHSRKDLIKYADITPMWTAGQETFPKSFPYLVLGELNVSSYHGFNFYLSSRAEYMRKMPIQGEVAMNPDWQYLRRSGADFLVARESDLKGGGLAAVTAQVRSEDIYRAPRGVVVVPLEHVFADAPSSPRLFDNGYVRVTVPSEGTPRKLENIARGKPVRQSSTAGGDAARAVDGNTNGDFAAGSVSHTGRDPNAWLEIDLGRVEAIDSVRIWNRTDCCGSRLRDYWIFVSEAPFADGDTAAKLRERKGTWGKVNLTPSPSATVATPGVSGRYVRVQLGGAASDEAILSLAEVEVFRADPSQTAVVAKQRPDVKVLDFSTNNANQLRIKLESSAPASVELLLSDNPRLRYYLNGDRIEPVERDGLRVIDVPPGTSSIEMRYRHWPLTVFWLICLGYVVALAVALALAWRRERDLTGRAPEDKVAV